MRDALTETISGYSRAQVDEFLAAIESERARLATELAHVTDRLRRARAALGMHRVMMAMLLAAHRELQRIRAEADAQVAKILADADEEAALLSGAVVAPAGPARPIVATRVDREIEVDNDPDGYFEFLRGALVDGEPLGPREGHIR